MDEKASSAVGEITLSKRAHGTWKGLLIFRKQIRPFLNDVSQDRSEAILKGMVGWEIGDFRITLFFSPRNAVGVDSGGAMQSSSAFKCIGLKQMMQRRNRVGEITEPWGTLVTGKREDDVLPAAVGEKAGDRLAISWCLKRLGSSHRTFKKGRIERQSNGINSVLYAICLSNPCP